MSEGVHEAIFRSQPEEHASSSLTATGEIPRELRGTFLRSGPGLLEVGGDTLNFFDGHALIAGVSFADGRATFRSRHVRSPLYQAETAARAMTKRRIFTNLPSRWSNLFGLALGNAAMHDVYAWGGKIFAGNDPGHFALDAKTLETLGPERWGGAVAAGEEMGPMPYRDPASGRLVGWIKKPGGLRPDVVRFVELDEGLRVVKDSGPLALDASPVLVHDQRASARWYVATAQAVRLDAGAAIWGKKTLYEAFVTPPGKTAEILLVPREGAVARDVAGRLVRVPLPAGLEIAFHVINAHDDGERVVVDLVTYAGRICFEGASSEAHRRKLGIQRRPSPRPTPMRFVVDPERGAILEHRALGALPIEAPEVADERMGRPYRFFYGPTLGDQPVPDEGGYFFYGALGKVDVETGAASTWSAGPGAVVSPPAFVARPGAEAEDEGWLLSYVLRGDGPSGARASVVVLDARDLARGPLATVELGVHLPGVSHTRWAGDVQLAG